MARTSPGCALQNAEARSSFWFMVEFSILMSGRTPGGFRIPKASVCAPGRLKKHAHGTCALAFPQWFARTQPSEYQRPSLAVPVCNQPDPGLETVISSHLPCHQCYRPFDAFRISDLDHVMKQRPQISSMHQPRRPAAKCFRCAHLLLLERIRTAQSAIQCVGEPAQHPVPQASTMQRPFAQTCPHELAQLAQLVNLVDRRYLLVFDVTLPGARFKHKQKQKQNITVQLANPPCPESRTYRRPFQAATRGIHTD